MHFVIFGTNSYVARVIIPILLSHGHEITSVGRSHHELTKERFALKDLEGIEVTSSSIFLYLLMDYSNIRCRKKFEYDNMKLLDSVLVNTFRTFRFVILGSDSARESSKSHYGLYKYQQSLRIQELGLSEIRIGWLDDFSTQENTTRKILKLFGKLPVNVLPLFKTLKINRTRPESLARELENLANITKPTMISLYDEEVPLISFVYGDKRPFETFFVRKLSGFFLSLLYSMRYLLKSDVVRAVDSARSLL